MHRHAAPRKHTTMPANIKVCMVALAGKNCILVGCNLRHDIADNTRESLIRKFKTIPCKNATHCQIADCLFAHAVGEGMGPKQNRRTCMHTLAGRTCNDCDCEFSHDVNEKTRMRLLQVYAAKPCIYGTACQDQECIFGHSRSRSETNDVQSDCPDAPRIKRPIIPRLDRKLVSSVSVTLIGPAWADSPGHEQIDPLTFQEEMEAFKTKNK